MTTKEEEERFVRLTSENEELKAKISEKERQIDEVKSKIDQLTKEQLEKRKSVCEDKGGEKQIKTILKKAVRIQEPDEIFESRDRFASANNNPHRMDSIEDSGFTSNKTVSKPSEGEFSESYL